MKFEAFIMGLGRKGRNKAKAQILTVEVRDQIWPGINFNVNNLGKQIRHPRKIKGCWIFAFIRK